MGWIITLSVLFLLVILPLGAAVRYNADGFSLKVIAGPFRISVLPGKKKESGKEPAKAQKKAQKKKAKPSQTPQKKEEKPKEKGGPITDFLPLVKTALDLLNSFRRKLRVKRLELKLILAGDDPCDLAVNYGKANAAMGNLLPLLEQCFVIKKRDVQVECDFTSSETKIIACADITITLGWLLGILVFYSLRALKQFLKINKSRKGGAST